MHIKTENLSLQIDGNNILSDISLDIEAQTIAIIGENGSGKSSFLQVISGLSKASAGKAAINGIDSMSKKIRDEVGVIFTDPAANIIMQNPYEDLLFSAKHSAKNIPKNKDEILRQIKTLLAEFNLENKLYSNIYELSSGQKQIIAIAANLIRRPNVIIADEITTLLDLKNTRIVADILFNRLKQGVIFSTHNLSLAKQCEKAILFHSGKVERVGPPEKVVNYYKSKY